MDTILQLVSYPFIITSVMLAQVDAGFMTAGTCSIQLNPAIINRGHATVVTLDSTNHQKTITFEGVQYNAGQNVTIYPTDTTQLSAQVTGTPNVCTATIVVEEPQRVEQVNACLDETLMVGDENSSVKMMQKFLSVQGYKIDPTGYFGEKTKKIVMQFERDNADAIVIKSGFTRPIGVWGHYAALKATELGLCDLK